MRVFVTGATGWVGSAVVKDLIGAGHQVIGLARSDAGAGALASWGAEVPRGSLEDLDAVRSGAGVADGVIHTAFDHDFSRFAASSEADRRAIEALADVLAGSDRPLLVTAGLVLLAPGRVATEGDSAPPISGINPRASEAAAVAARARGVRASVVRLPPSVHGIGDHGFVPTLIGTARDKGGAAYIGNGDNRWSAVHRQDAARLYRLALEHGAQAECYHAVADEGVPFREIAAMIGRHLGLPVQSLAREAAAEHFGWFALFAGMDVPASSDRTSALLGWAPTGPDLLSDLDQPGYFQ